MGASFSDFVGGVKDLTNAAKDVKGLVTGEPEKAQSEKQQAMQKKPSKKQQQAQQRQEEQGQSRGGWYLTPRALYWPILWARMTSLASMAAHDVLFHGISR